jgi:putative flippase GtrA
MNRLSAVAATLQLARFCGVGVICLIVSTLTLATLHDLAGLHYLLAFAISFCVGNVLGYTLNGRFTFSTPLTRAGIFRYLLLNGTLLIVNSGLMKALVDGLHVWYIGASLLLAMMNAPVSFLLHRSFSYAAASTEDQSHAPI